MKICIKCNTVKPNESFHKDNLRKDGLFPYCKNCRSTPKKPVKYRSAKEVLSNHIITNNGCWEWEGTLSKDGYGVACFKSKRQRAHRLSYSYFKGVIKDDLLICHTCDNRSCINPDHLYQGTNQDNSNDMVKRNRHNPLKGEKSANSVLTEKQVLLIRSDQRKHKFIASDFNIAVSTVSGIKVRRIWSHL